MTASRLIQICRQRLRSLLQKERLDDQIDQELLFHLEQLEKENIEAGMGASEARVTARRALGNVAVFKEECRDERRVSWLYDFFQDLRYGMRMMRRSPGFTAIAAISLALAIGANAAILNVGAAILFGDLPLPQAERLVVIRTISVENPAQRTHASVPDYVGWNERNRTFESMGASIANQQDLAGDDFSPAPEHLFGQAVTPSLLETLDVQPQLGRLFRNDEGEVGTSAPVIILSDRLWQRRFAGDSKILGKEIRMNGRNLKVVGVMPPGFWYPIETSEYWVPLAFTRFQLDGSARLFMVTGRLKAGKTIAEATADVESVAAQLIRDPDRQREWKTWIVPIREQWFGWVHQPLVTLEAAVILVLLIACANVATLLTARVPARQPEIAMRLLMGASWGRIVRQFLTESLLLSSIGGALGVLVAWWGVHSLEGLQPPPGGIPIGNLGRQGAGILGLAALLSVTASLLFGFIPALTAFSSGTTFRQAAVHRRRGRLSSILVSAQVGLALILLISSGLLINSFVRLVLDDRAFNPNGVLTFEYRIPVQDYLYRFGSYRGMPAMDIAPPTLAMQRVYEKLKTLPGAESVAAASAPPVNGLVPPRATLFIHGRPVPVNSTERAAATVYYFLVTENFFGTLKTPLIRGRGFGDGDTPATPWVAVINETMANRFWPNEDPIGKHFTVDAASGERPREVIGVVRDVALRYVRTGPPEPVAYTLYLQQPERYEGFNTGMFGQMTFFIRSGQDPMSLVPAARRAVAEVDPNRPLANIQMMEAFVGEGMRTRRYSASVLGAFAFMATLLAAVGVYGVMSSSVSQRTREIGIRIAMGARRRDIIRLVGARALRLVAIGLSAGLFASLLIARLIEVQLWGITSTDPGTFAVVIAFLAGVSMVACFIPARRAMRVDPAEALRAD